MQQKEERNAVLIRSKTSLVRIPDRRVRIHHHRHKCSKSNNIKNRISSWILCYPRAQITDRKALLYYSHLFFFYLCCGDPEGNHDSKSWERNCATPSSPANRKLAIQQIIYSSCSSQQMDWWMASHTWAVTPLISFSYNPRLLIQDNVML